MIYYLTDSLRGSDEELGKIRHHLRNLALAAIEGNHDLYGDEDILKDCVRLFEGDDEVNGFFRSLYTNWSSRPIPECVSCYIEVVKGDLEKRIEGSKTIIQCPISLFYKQESLIPCQLICENDNDCMFYKLVGDRFVKERHLNANIEIRAVGSGGCSLAKRMMKKHLSYGQICLCILDSDIWYPGCTINKDSKGCAAEFKDKPRCKCIILDVSEIENLLPLNFVDDVFATNSELRHPVSKEYKQHFDYLRNKRFAEEILPYFDYKEGIRKNNNFMQDTDMRAFAEKCWRLNPEINKCGNFNEYVNEKKQGELIYSPLGRKIADEVINYMTEGEKAEPPVLLQFQEREWNRIGQEIANWGYARIPEGIS